VTDPSSGVQPPPPIIGDDGIEQWRDSARGYQFVTARGRPGLIRRRGDETVEQARARDETEHKVPKAPPEPTSGPEPESKPKRGRPPKTKMPPLPPASAKIDLKELEKTLAEALKAPGMLCASFGDEWAANHFANAGPYLARNLILASQHNPWLRAKLEEAATGQDAMMKIVSLVGVGGALVTYMVPPVIWWLNLPVPDKTRELFGIPERRERKPDYAAGAQDGRPPSPEAPEPAPAAY
jgi:hypothetical protein